MVGSGSEAGHAETVRKERGQRQGQQPEAPKEASHHRLPSCFLARLVWMFGRWDGLQRRGPIVVSWRQ